MTELTLVAISASLVNAVLLTGFPGLGTGVGVNERNETARILALVTLVVVTAVSFLAYAIYHWVLEPLGVGYLRTFVLLLVALGCVRLAAICLHAIRPKQHPFLGTILTMTATNCAVLGIALLSFGQRPGLLASLTDGAFAGTAFGVVLVTFAALRDRLDSADVPAAFRGVPIVLMTAGLGALALLGFRGLGGP